MLCEIFTYLNKTYYSYSEYCVNVRLVTNSARRPHSNVSSTTTQTANDLAARRQLSDPSLFHGGRQGVKGPGSPRRQENVPSRTVEENVPQRMDVPPRTFQEYLQKYYSDQPRVSRSEDESSYYSDGVVDYGDSG